MMGSSRLSGVARLCGPLWFVPTSLFFGAGLLFAGFYLAADYQALADWYTGLNNCFYRAAEWPQEFFTPQVKAQGNLFCALALALCMGWLGYLGYRGRRLFRQPPSPRPALVAAPAPSTRLAAALYPLVLLATVAGLWLWGNSLVAPAYDEVFSADACARLPAFQTVSYYMAPNNHLLFNLLNGSLFHWAADLVETGRLLSGVLYAAVVLVAYYWFNSLFRHRLLALGAALVVALQFPLWGFAVQARGYELYALAHWLAFIGLMQYLHTGEQRWLRLNALACAVGYAAVPSFLYFHAAQLAFGFGWQLLRRPDVAFWKYQALALSAVYLFYLPALCFSGLDALTNNRFVQPLAGTIAEFGPLAAPVLESYAEYCFSDPALLGYPLGKLLLALPLLLLLARRHSIWFSLGCFYVLLVLAFVGAVFVMRRYTFHRNLIGHFSLALAFVVATGYWLLEQLPPAYRATRRALPLVLLALALVAGHFIRHNAAFVANNLYFYDTQAAYNMVGEALGQLPAGSTFACSDNSFYWRYVAREKEVRPLPRCTTTPADYYITTQGELAAAGAPAGYDLLRTVEDYQIYKRR